MPVLTPPTLTDAPTSPDRADRATFTARSIALDNWRKNQNVPEMRLALANVEANAADAAASASASSASASASSASASASSASANNAQTYAGQAALYAGATAWAAGVAVTANPITAKISQIDFQTYRCILAHTTVTDPKNDPTHWVIVNGLQSGASGATLKLVGTLPTWIDQRDLRSALESGRADLIASNGTWTPPAGTTQVRLYAFGAGGNGASATVPPYIGSGGGGGGCAYGTLVTPATITVAIAAGVTTVSVGGQTILTANRGVDGVAATGAGQTVVGGAGGTAAVSNTQLMTNIGAYSGGAGGYAQDLGAGGTFALAGGGSSGSPLGTGGVGGYARTSNGGYSYAGGAGWGGAGGGGDGSNNSHSYFGGGGVGGAGALNASGGAFGAASANTAGIGLVRPWRVSSRYQDPLLYPCIHAGQGPTYTYPQTQIKTYGNGSVIESGGFGGGGGGNYSGGFGGGGGANNTGGFGGGGGAGYVSGQGGGIACVVIVWA